MNVINMGHLDICIDLDLSTCCGVKYLSRYIETGNISVGTFNTFLLRSAPMFQERKELLIETVDIFCMCHVFATITYQSLPTQLIYVTIATQFL